MMRSDDEALQELRSMARTLVESKGKSFVEKIRLLGLDPTTDFRHCDLSGIAFDGEDLRGFDFTDANLMGCSFRNAIVVGVITKGATLDDHAFDSALTKSVILDRLAITMRAYPFFSEMFPKDAAASTLMEMLRARKARFLTRDELLKIIRIAGTGASLSLAGDIGENAIEWATEAALATSSDEDAITRLRELLPGVGVVTASTILSWCKPDIWPIIDRTALNALAEFGLIAPRPKKKHPDLSDWLEFVGLVRGLSDRLNWEPYKASRWLHAFGECELKAAQLSGKWAGTETSFDPSS